MIYRAMPLGFRGHLCYGGFVEEHIPEVVRLEDLPPEHQEILRKALQSASEGKFVDRPLRSRQKEENE